MSLGILCPGQGDQSAAMLAPLLDSQPARAILSVAETVMGADPRSLALDDFHLNRIAQPLVCAVQAATWAALCDQLPEPRVFAGYSIGELIAYGCARGLDPTSLIQLAAQRARAMDEAFPEPTGMVAARGLSRRRMDDLCRTHGVEIAIVNDLDRFVIGGRVADLNCFENEAIALGAKVTPLKITIASHTSFMKSAVGSFRKSLEDSALKSPQIPVLAGINGARITTRDRAIETLAEQVAHTVDWSCCLDGVSEMGCRVLLELGPGNGLARMARDRFPHIPIRSVSEFSSLGGVVDWVHKNI